MNYIAFIAWSAVMIVSGFLGFLSDNSGSLTVTLGIYLRSERAVAVSKDPEKVCSAVNKERARNYLLLPFQGEQIDDEHF